MEAAKSGPVALPKNRAELRKPITLPPTCRAKAAIVKGNMAAMKAHCNMRSTAKLSTASLNTGSTHDKPYPEQGSLMAQVADLQDKKRHDNHDKVCGKRQAELRNNKSEDAFINNCREGDFFNGLP